MRNSPHLKEEVTDSGEDGDEYEYVEEEVEVEVASAPGKVGKPKKLVRTIVLESQIEIKKSNWRVDESQIGKLNVADKWKPESQIAVEKSNFAKDLDNRTVGKVSPRNFESQIEVKKNRWAAGILSDT